MPGPGFDPAHPQFSIGIVWIGGTVESTYTVYNGLHTWQEGVWGDHTLPVIQNIVPLLGSDVLAKFETTQLFLSTKLGQASYLYRLYLLPRWKDLKTFKSGVFGDFNDGT